MSGAGWTFFSAPVALFAISTDNKVMLDPDHPLAELLLRDQRYHRDAYFFVFEALRYAQEQLVIERPQSSDELELEEHRHVTGQQLCESIRRYAIEQYGLMAKCVLNEWGVRSTGDFGEIVFNLIDIGQMKKTDSDRREDFENVFDFGEGLRDSFLPITSDS